jgi:hypothetical protein
VLTVVRTVGRLVEARFSGNPSESDVVTFRQEADSCVRTAATLSGKPVVCCTDMRASALFRPSATEELITMMRADRSAIERNGILGTGGALFTLQLQRLLREAAGGEGRRRVFTDESLLFSWLDEVLTPGERIRARQFVAEFSPPASEVAASTSAFDTSGRGRARDIRGLRTIKGGRS